jgi:hypothetical protein
MNNLEDGWDKKPQYWEKIDKQNITNNIHEINNYKNIKKIDGIFVLAGGIEQTGRCHEWINDRLKLTYKYYKNYNVPIFTLGGGSYHIKPILNKNGFIIHESTSCSEYLISLGVKPNMIYKEWSSYDTIANGFFAFTNFIIPLQLKSIVLITSAFHMNRSRQIFEWIKTCFSNNISIEYIESSNNNIDKHILDIRIEREQKSLENLKNNIINKYNTLDKLHKWFYTEHKAYCSNSEIIRICDINENEKKTY